MTGLRIVIGLLVAVAIGIALVPLWVLLDLRQGGSGWGICPAGVNVCRNGYFSGFEMLAMLTVALFGVVALIALCVRVMRLMERRRRTGRGPLTG